MQIKGELVMHCVDVDTTRYFLRPAESVLTLGSWSSEWNL